MCVKVKSMKMFTKPLLAGLMTVLTFAITGSLFGNDGRYVKSIPINIVDGIGSVQPKIALTYNSDQKTGLAGAGWTLSGIPFITGNTVSGQTVYNGPHGRLVLVESLPTEQKYRYYNEKFSVLRFYTLADGVTREWEETNADGIRFYFVERSNNNFALDRVEAKNGLGYQVYYTTFSGHQKYYPEQIVYTTHASLATTKRIYIEYESRPDTRLAYFNGSDVTQDKRISAIRVEDNVSCTLSICGDLVRKYRLNYSEDGSLSLSRLISVEVSDTSGSQFINVESFEYPVISAQNYSTIEAGGYALNNQPLVEYYASDLTKPVYRGTYADVNSDGLVDKVISFRHPDTGAHESQTYINTGSGWVADQAYNLPLPIYHNFMSGSNVKVYQYGVLVDLNSDGQVDFIYSKPNNTKVYLNKNGTWEYTTQYSMPPGQVISGVNSNTPKLGKFIDINGDGHIDWVCAYKTVDNVSMKSTWLGDGQGGWTESVAYKMLDHFWGYSSSKKVQIEYAYLIDINSDGLPDIVRSNRRANGNIYQNTWLNTGSGWLENTGMAPRQLIDDYIQGYDKPIKRGLFIDVNGDGLLDQVTSFRRPGGNFNSLTHINTGNSFVYNASYNTPWPVYDYWMDQNIVSSFCNNDSSCISSTNLEGYKYRRTGVTLTDINADGLVDMVASYYQPYGAAQRNTWLNTGAGWVDSGKAYQAPGYSVIYDKIGSTFLFLVQVNNRHLFDINGDSVPDWVANGGAVASYLTRVTANDILPNKITRTVGVNGGYTDIQYAKSVFLPGFIQNRFDSFPSIADRRVRQVVSSITDHDGRGASYATQMTYSDLRFYNGNILDRRTLGPASVQIDSFNGSSAITYFHQGENTSLLLAGWPMSKKLYNNGALVKEETMNYEVMPFVDSLNNPLGTYYVRSKSSISGPAKVLKEYDPQGALTRHEEMLFTYQGYLEYDIALKSSVITNLMDPNPANPNTVLQSHILKNFFNPVSADHVVGEVNRAQTFIQGVLQTDVKSQYDANHNLIQSSVFLSTTGLFVDTTFTHDEFGNLQDTISPLGIKTVNTVTYEPQWQVTVSVTANDNSVTFNGVKTYDRFGNLTLETDTKGRVVKEMTYDTFGRLLTVKNGNGVLVEEYLYYDNLLGDPNAQYTEKRTYDLSGSFLSEKNYFDGLKRTYKKAEDVYDNSGKMTRFTFVEYDAAGRSYRESIPIFSTTDQSVGSVTRWKTNTYDTYGRIIGQSAPAVNSGADTTVQYSYGVTQGLRYTSATDVGGNVDTTYYNALGEVDRKVDPSGAITWYAYDFANRVYTVTDADGKQTVTTLDNWGNKIGLVEPNSGSWTFTYDNESNIVSKTGPGLKTVFFEYDGLNRKTYVTDAANMMGATYTYDNDPASNGFGEIKSVSDDSGVTTFYFDPQGRRERVSKLITPVPADPFNTVPFTMQYQYVYDNLNRVTQLIYPDGSILNHSYSPAGHLQELRLKTLSDGVTQTGESTIVTYQGPFDIDNTAVNPSVKRITGNGVETTVSLDRLTGKVLGRNTMLQGGAVYQDLAYTYDLFGNITTITDNLDASRTETYVYDSIGRLVNANSGLYGNLSYTYSLGGNLIQKGDRTLYYQNNPNPAPGSNNNCSVSVQAVCSDSYGNSYDYDANGNMIGRGDHNADTYRTFYYDSANRLTKVMNSQGVVKTSFGYDYDNARVSKVSADGAVTYFFGGMYEVLINPNGSEYHTKYIRGAKGELVAQHSLDTSHVTLASLNERFYVAHAGVSVNFSSIANLGQSIGARILTLYNDFNARRVPIYVYLLMLSLLALLAIYVKHNYRLMKERRNNDSLSVKYIGARKLGFAETALLVTFMFLSTFSFQCFNGPTVGEPVPFSAFDPASSSALVSDNLFLYNDAAVNARPTLGLLYFHANHLGSTTLVTDDSGTVVTKIAYKPYGEIVRDVAASNGPDVIRAKFTGQADDPETSLLFYNARYYDPGLGRFLSIDNFNSDSSSQGFNRYMYALGNPVNFIDPSGHANTEPFWMIVGGFFLMGVGLALTLAGNVGGISMIIVGALAFIDGIDNASGANSFNPPELTGGACLGNCGGTGTGSSSGGTSVMTGVDEQDILISGLPEDPGDSFVNLSNEEIAELDRRMNEDMENRNRFLRAHEEASLKYKGRMNKEDMTPGEWEEFKGILIRDMITKGATGEQFDQQIYINDDARTIVYMYNKTPFQAYFFNKTMEINGKLNVSNYSNIDLGHYLGKVTPIVTAPLGRISGAGKALEWAGSLPEWGPIKNAVKWGYEQFGNDAVDAIKNSSVFSNDITPQGDGWSTGGEFNHQHGLQDVENDYNDFKEKWLP